MPRTQTLTSVEIDVEEKPRPSAVLDPDEPFRILVMGNFSGGAGRNRRPVEIDRDNFDEVMARIAPELRINSNGVDVRVQFRDLDDFHPDRLLARLPLFQKLRDFRTRLEDPSTFRAAAAELEPPATPPKAAAAHLSGADLLSQMADEEDERADESPLAGGWDRLVSGIVTRYATPGPDPRQPQWIARIDEAITGEMRTLLHSSEFQALESAWRGIYFLTRRLETGQELKVYLMDLPQEEVTAGTGLADIARALSGEPMAVMAGLYAFGKRDTEALERLAAMAQEANVPFLAGLASDVVGMEEVFGEMRATPKARWIGLVMPRFLLRLPYGEETDETETFRFEEMPAPPQHERYLWGNSSLACAYLLGEAFQRYGWQMRPGIVQDIEGLPAHVYKVDGAPEMKPCAEILLTESAASLLLDRGFMPLASMKGSDRVRLVRFQSLARPAAALAGKWN